MKITEQQQVITSLTNQISSFPSIHKIMLYGSRSRGDNSIYSDIDIAVTGDFDLKEWTQIKQLADVDDPRVKTLLKIDLVRLDEVDPEVRNSIEKEGKILYERKSSNTDI